MFDKKKFSNILQKISDTYESISEFAEKSKVNRTYISKYINEKLDAPPSPKVLLKIANNSNKITNYEELMLTCGYLEKDMEIEELLKKTFQQYLPTLKKLNVDNALINTMYNQLLEPQKYAKEFSKMVSKLPSDKQEKVYTISSEMLRKSNELMANSISNIGILTKYDIDYTLSNKVYMCPVYGQISAGQPNWAEECIEGRLPIDPNLMNIVDPEECYFLRVNGESMNKVVKNGAYALIRKTDWVDDGEIAVVLVNGYDATLKKFSKQGDFVVLEPMSNDPSFQTQIYTKDTPIKIIGKYIGKFEMKN